MSSVDRPDAHAPLVSVLIPTHNRPQWLPRAVRSVLDGEFKELEVIVSNNGDPEHTRRLAAEIQDPRIRWVEYDRSSGMIEHLLSLFPRASGKYVAMLHDDDWWDGTFLAKLVPALEERDDAVLAFADHHEVDADGVADPEAAERLSVLFGRANRAQGYYMPFFDVPALQSAALPASVMRRDALDLTDFSTDMAHVLDLWILYVLAATGKAAYFHRERLLYLRAHVDSASSRRGVDTYTGAILFRKRMLQDPRMAPYASVIRAKLSRDHISAGASLLRGHVRDEARRHLLQSLRLRPHARAVGGLLASWIAPDAVLDRI